MKLKASYRSILVSLVLWVPLLLLAATHKDYPWLRVIDFLQTNAAVRACIIGPLAFVLALAAYDAANGDERGWLLVLQSMVCLVLTLSPKAVLGFLFAQGSAKPADLPMQAMLVVLLGAWFVLLTATEAWFFFRAKPPATTSSAEPAPEP